MALRQLLVGLDKRFGRSEKKLILRPRRYGKNNEKV